MGKFVSGDVKALIALIRAIWFAILGRVPLVCFLDRCEVAIVVLGPTRCVAPRWNQVVHRVVPFVDELSRAARTRVHQFAIAGHACHALERRCNTAIVGDLRKSVLADQENVMWRHQMQDPFLARLCASALFLAAFTSVHVNVIWVRAGSVSLLRRASRIVLADGSEFLPLACIARTLYGSAVTLVAVATPCVITRVRSLVIQARVHRASFLAK